MRRYDVGVCSSRAWLHLTSYNPTRLFGRDGMHYQCIQESLVSHTSRQVNDERHLTHPKSLTTEKMTSVTRLIITAYKCILESICTLHAATTLNQTNNDAAMYTLGICTPLRNHWLNASPALYFSTLNSKLLRAKCYHFVWGPASRNNGIQSTLLQNTIYRDTGCWVPALKCLTMTKFVGTTPQIILPKQPRDNDTWSC